MGQGINVLSYFDGCSGGNQALEMSGIKVKNYFACEVDKYAIAVTQKNYPNVIQLGDVTKVNLGLLPKIDLFIGGSPCQSFSFAGKRKGMATKDNIEIYTLDHYLTLKEQGFEFEGQSFLFWEYMRALTYLRKINPKVKFLLENVEMGEKWEKVLSKAIGVNGIHINSALLTAQNRKRIYWTNIGMQPSGLFGDLESVISQPKDKGILLKDILEQDVESKYYLSEKIIAGFEKYALRHLEKKTGFAWNPNDGTRKGSCLRANAALSPTDNILKIDKKGNIKDNQDKASCFTAGGNSGGNHSDMDLIVKCAAMRGRNPKSRVSGLPTQQQIEPRSDDKTNCLTSVQKDNLVLSCDYRSDEGFRFREGGESPTLMARAREDIYGNPQVIQVNPSKESGGKQPYQQNRIYSDNGLMTCLDTDSGRKNVLTNYSIRRLTPIECERLQGMKDNYTQGVSDSQRYKMIGNGWTIPVISHIFNYYKNENN